MVLCTGNKVRLVVTIYRNMQATDSWGIFQEFTVACQAGRRAARTIQKACLSCQGRSMKLVPSPTLSGGACAQHLSDGSGALYTVLRAGGGIVIVSVALRESRMRSIVLLRLVTAQ